jgi:hypothetical protein
MVNMRAISFASVTLLAVGCGSGTPADVEGHYSFVVTSRENECNFPGWTTGEVSSPFNVTVNQQDESVSANVEGAVGGFLALWLGTNVYTGTIDGDDLQLQLLGTNEQTMGSCAFTYNSRIIGAADDDTLTGRVEYSADGDGDAACASIDGCISYQDFNGIRPPE